MKKTFIIIFFLMVSTLPTFAQKRVIDTAAYKDWKMINDPKMSQDGQWVLYRYGYLDPDEISKDSDFTILFNTKTKKEVKIKGATSVNFINNGKWIRYEIFKDNTSSTILKCLKTGEVFEWNRSEYIMSSEHSPWINYSYTPHQEGYQGRRYVLYNIEKKDSLSFENLTSYKLLNTNSLAYIQVRNEDAFLIYNEGLINPKIIFKAEKELLNNFSLDENTKKGTFILKDKSGQNKFLYEFNLKGESPKLRIDFDKVPEPVKGFSMERSNYETNGKSVIFPYLSKSVRTPYSPPKKDELGLEIWKWNEGALARRQRLISNGNSRLKPLDFAYNIDANTFVPLTVNPDERLIKPEYGNNTYFFVTDPTPYAVDIDWTFEEIHDVYLVETKTGKRQQIIKATADVPSWSPDGKYAVIFNSEKRAWEQIQITNGSVSFFNLTKNIPYPVYDEGFDVPLSDKSYGIIGWTNHYKTMVIADKYDFWAIDMTHESAPKSITKGYGRKNHVQLRLILIDYDSNLDFKKEVILKGFNDINKSSGVYKIKKGIVKKMIDGNFNTKIISASVNSKYVLWYKESYSQSPNLWWSNSEFSNPLRVSNINPQEEELAWGTTKVFSWKDDKGEQNEGLLFLPENYNPKQKYPVIVNFYEKSTPDRFTFWYPTYSESSLNIPTYVSQNYIVFKPDISFKIGHTGESASNIIISGTKELIKQGIADEKHIGIHGHSFGAYQTAYTITQTDMFTCAVPASVTTNLTSGYTSLRGNGLSSMFMYESGQMRMGKSMYDDMDGYIKNSPIFHVKDIHTPLLIFHCDADGTVPYEQGMSLFLSMRRLKKPVWLINYKGERHDLSKTASKIDWTLKLQSFFDYHLKDASRPDWME